MRRMSRRLAIVLPLSLVSTLLTACPADEDEPGDYGYDDTIEAQDPMPEPRFAHTATTLPDGRVLIIGGTLGSPADLDIDAFVAEADLWDPSSNSFTRGASLEVPRTWHSATLLADGRVVVLGGSTDQGLPGPAFAIEVWNPDSESFSTVGELDVNLIYHCALPLGAESVLVLDDCDPGECTAMRLNPDSGAVTELGGLPTYRYTLDVDCAQLPDGRVLLAGGIDDISGEPVADVELYDPSSESFEVVAGSATGFGAYTRVVALDGDEVLILGDALGTLGQVYSAGSGQLRPIESDGVAVNRVEHVMTLLADGRVLVSGGRIANSPTLELAPGLDVYDPANNTLTRVNADIPARFGHAVARLHDGPALIVGGRGEADRLADAYLYR